MVGANVRRNYQQNQKLVYSPSFFGFAAGNLALKRPPTRADRRRDNFSFWAGVVAVASSFLAASSILTPSSAGLTSSLAAVYFKWIEKIGVGESISRQLFSFLVATHLFYL